MEIINTIELYFKAEKVLLSCKNTLHLKSALNYINLYHKLTEDFSGYNVLLRKHNKLYEEFYIYEKPTNS